jgi:hypothetical protein
MLSPKAKETLRLVKDTDFLRKDLLMVFKDASTRIADNRKEESKIAEEIFNTITKELLR